MDRFQRIAIITIAFGLASLCAAAFPARADAEQLPPRLTTLEIRYRVPEAEQVYLVWGVNNWNPVPEAQRPPDTEYSGRTLQTPMRAEGDRFVIALQVEPGSVVNYGFQLRRIKSAGQTKWLWDGDYQVSANTNKVTEHQTSLMMVRVKELVRPSSTKFYIASALTLPFVAWGVMIVSRRAAPRLAMGLVIVTLNLSAVAMSLIVAEIYVRYIGMEPYVRTFPEHRPSTGPVSEWVQLDSDFGWVSNTKHPDVNAQGFRDPKDFGRVDYKAPAKRLMILGDSFMWGAGVNSDESVPRLLEARLGNGYEVYNLGVPGWGIGQMYLAYLKYRDVIRPDTVMLAYIDDDVNRELESYRKWERLSRPSFSVEHGKLIERPPASTTERIVNKAAAQSVIFSILVRQVYWILDARPIVKTIFLEMVQQTAARHEQFVVLRIPTRDFGEGSGQNYWIGNFRGVLEGEKVHYLEAREEFMRVPRWNTELYSDASFGHLSVKGNRFLADYLYEDVFSHGLRSLSAPVLHADAGETPPVRIVTQEIRYHVPEAGQIFLIWGTDGWKLAPEALRPAGTVVENKVMATPMERSGDSFVVKLPLPEGSSIDYGFQIRTRRDGSALPAWTWDGDYHTLVSNRVVEKAASLSGLRLRGFFRNGWLWRILLIVLVGGAGLWFLARLQRRLRLIAEREKH